MAKPFGISKSSLVVTECSEIVKAPGSVGMVRSQRFLSDRQRSLIEACRLSIPALLAVELGQVVETGRHIRMFLAQRLLQNG